MGTVRLGSIVSDIRGSVGQQTYARNPGGVFVRERISPTQVPSAERALRQAALTAISQAWSGTLDQAQRNTWIQYGRQHPHPAKFGSPTAYAGSHIFTRCNLQEFRTTAAIQHLTAPAHPAPAAPWTSMEASPVLRWAVTGNPVPDCTGGFQDGGVYNGKPWAKHDTLDFWNWYGWDPAVWRITTGLGELTTYRWSAGQVRANPYTAGGSATGTPTLAAADPGYELTIALPPATIPDPPAGLQLFLYLSNQRNAGVTYHRTPFRYAGSNSFDGADWTADPWTIPWQDFYTEGGVQHLRPITAPCHIFGKLIAVLADGATSSPGFFSCPVPSTA